ncbi:MAG: hypothetical protein NTV17_07050, partial [Burkholderiales bacterium]|nr:hypothetical protein [Burkholderiales bacterium]
MIRAVEPSSPEWLAAGFAEQVVQWARPHCASLSADALKRVGLAAHRLSLATSAGHVCLPLQDLITSDLEGAHANQPPLRLEDLRLEDLRQALLDSGIVGTPQHPGACPMILDDFNRLYLHRYFD